jgi:superfamily II DNA or RNA helicase
MFLNDQSIRTSWQAFERLIARFLLHAQYEGVRLVGRSGDKGADIVTSFKGKRWLFQAKHWDTRVGLTSVEEVISALREYEAEIPVLISLNGFHDVVFKHRKILWAQGTMLQLWSGADLVSRASLLADDYPCSLDDVFENRSYQEDAIRAVVEARINNTSGRALVVMATGLGKTRVVFEAIRRISGGKRLKVLAIAHTNELVCQIEKASWPYLRASQETAIWNGIERQNESSLSRADFVFACVNTVDAYLRKGGDMPDFDVLFVDECHHAGNDGMYARIFEKILAGRLGGPFLVGVTATPWRSDESHIREFFGEPLVSVDMVTGLRRGYLSNVDYRMYATNIDWERLKIIGSKKRGLSPKRINRTLFINEWDDSVVEEIRTAWNEQASPRVIVFCGTVDHAVTMAEKINALHFCRAEALYARRISGEKMDVAQRNKILCDFHDGRIQVVCAVEIFNEGIDVPDVNIIVFQRVTHSRRIFVQQLGRGLRLSPSKEKVIVLDFVSDVRRFAAGLALKDSLAQAESRQVRVDLNHCVAFHRYGGKDQRAESFLREWLDDIAAIEEADENAHVLKFPPEPPRNG